MRMQRVLHGRGNAWISLPITTKITSAAAPLADARGFHEKAGLCQARNSPRCAARYHRSFASDAQPAISSSWGFLRIAAGTRQDRAAVSSSELPRAVGES